MSRESGPWMTMSRVSSPVRTARIPTRRGQSRLVGHAASAGWRTAGASAVRALIRVRASHSRYGAGLLRSYSEATMLTTRPRRPRANCTVPARWAKIVSSLPIPAPSPGRKRVPRWRTMISPPVTDCPANTLTPRRLAWESRPLRLEPSPFLCAILGVLLGLLRRRLRAASLGLQLDPGHLDAGELLPVPRAPLRALLGLELQHPELGAALVADHLRLDLDSPQVIHLDLVTIAPVEQRLEGDLGALVRGQPLDEEGLPLLDAVLLAAGLDDRVGHEDSALARDRRRPPLRPRRREDVDCRGWSSPFPASSPPPLSTSTALAAVRPTS